MPIPSLEDVAKKEAEYLKILAGGIWSIKPIALKVAPGDRVPLESIFLDDPEPYEVKDFEESFRDKYVCIFLLPISARHKESSFLDAMILREVHDQIRSARGNFGAICVGIHAQSQLDDVYSDDYFNPYELKIQISLYTPFPHIGIMDDACLTRVASKIGLPKETIYVILGPSKSLKFGRVISIFDSDFLHWHGAEAYPFTPHKIQQLAREDKALLSGKYDLITLLATPNCDFVISNDCTKVPISNLQEKTICLLFYEDNLECKRRTEELKQVYEAHKDFEVVVVFALNFGRDISHLVAANGKFKSELKFWKVFSNMPWLALPFDNPKRRQLWRIFNRTNIYDDSYAPKLIIIYSKGKYFEEEGFQVLKSTRFENYPFMGKEAVQTVVAERRIKLSSFLGQDVELFRKSIYGTVGWEHRGEQEKFTVSNLFGVLVVFLFIAVPGFTEFLSELRVYQLSECQTSSRFEVVYISMTESSSSVNPYMLVSPSDESKKQNLIPLFTQIFKDEMTQAAEDKKFTLALVTFGPFGHYFKQGIISTTSSDDASQLFVDTFPFMDDRDKEYYRSKHTNLEGSS